MTTPDFVSTSRASQGRRLPASIFILALFIMSFAFDYRSQEDQAQWPLYFLLFLMAISGLTLIVMLPRPPDSGGIQRLVSWMIAFGMVGSLLSLFINNVDVTRYAKATVSYWIFWLSYLIGTRLRPEHTLWTARFFAWAGFISIIFSLMLSLASGGAMEEVRYKIASPVILPFQAILIYNLIIRRRARFASFILLAFTGFIDLLSLTRSLVIGVVALFLIAFWLGSRNTVTFLGKFAFSALVAAAIGLGLLGLASQIVPGLAEGWGGRLVTQQQSGLDPTTITRLAELTDQLDRWKSSSTSMFFGQGYGADYGWSAKYYDDFDDMAGAVTKDDYEGQYWQLGHNFWIYSLFAGGALFGLLFPASILLVFGVAAIRLRSRRRLGGSGIDDSVLGYQWVMVLFSFLAITIGGNPMGPRFPSVMVGLAMGILVVILKSPRTRSNQLLAPDGRSTELREVVA